jgi:hypothetical protein
MTPEEKENALRAQARRCAEELTKAMSAKPKPKWNAVCPHPSQALREGKADGRQSGEICQCYWPHEWAVWSGIMKERGMIFNGEMVRALLEGRKTQTRRPIKWRQTRATEIAEREDGSKWPWSEDAENVCDYWHPCPFGAVGDRIWVRETWGVVSHELDEDGRIQPWTPDRPTTAINEMPFGNGYYSGHAIYAADGDFTWGDDDGYEDGRSCWKPSIHMPRAASRILLEITDVRVERLKNISDGDAIREGCSVTDMKSGDCVADIFARLWESIYGAESWQANPGFGSSSLSALKAVQHERRNHRSGQRAGRTSA